jgi:amidase
MSNFDSRFSISVENLNFLNAEMNLGLSPDKVDLVFQACKSISEEYKIISEMVDDVDLIERDYTAPEVNDQNAWTYKCEIQESKSGALANLKFAIKDSINLAGIPMSMGSELLSGWLPKTDATVITRILQNGGQIIGKTTTENLCISGGSVTSWPLAVDNPAAPGFSAGGSSSGSAAVVATGEVDVALGADQGGSIRIPAAFCGVLGHKPTHGLIPYSGITSLMPSLDHVGPIARSAEHLAITLDALAGPDEHDPRQNSLRGPASWPTGYQICTPEVHKGVSGLRIGLLLEGFEITASGDSQGFIGSAEASEIVRKQALRLEAMGAIVTPMSIPIHAMGSKIYGPILIDGIYQNLCLIAGRNFSGFGRDDSASLEITRRISGHPEQISLITAIALLAGRHMSLVDDGSVYAKASAQVGILKAGYNNAFENFDAIICPTTAPAGLPLAQTGDLSNLVNETMTFYANTAVANLTGHPSTSVPVGFVDGLPVGAMITTNYWQDACAIRIAQALHEISQ